MIYSQQINLVVLRLPDFWSNWNLEMLVLTRGENRSARRKPRRRDLNPGYIGGRRIGAPSLLPKKIIVKRKLAQLSVNFFLLLQIILIR